MTDHDDRQVPRPPSAWQKKVLANALPIARKARTAIQKRVIRTTAAWREKTGWKPKPKPKPVDQAAEWRKKIVEYALWAHRTYEGKLGYSQSRPKLWIRSNPSKWTRPFYADCSSFAIRAYQVAGAPSPSMYGYSGYGSTYDMEPRGQWVGNADPLPADLIFYQGHVAIYVGGGMAVGHGSSNGPVLLSINYRPDRTSNRRYF